MTTNFGGEIVQCWLIANTVYDAVGIRLREIPFTPKRVKAVLAEGK
jgi:hypothetical protein